MSGATVLVNGVAATGVTFVSATQVRATTPAGSAGARTVQITNPSGQSASLASAFTYVGGAGPDLGLADVGADGRRHDDHDHRQRLRLGRDGARQRRRGDRRHVRVGDAAARERRRPRPPGTVRVQVTNPDGQSAR